MRPAEAAERIATACEDAAVEAKGRRWKNAEGLLRDATNVAASMTSSRVWTSLGSRKWEALQRAMRKDAANGWPGR